MAFDSLAVANEILRTARRERIELTPLQLQKLLYYAQGWSLALFDRPLIDEQVEAWKYGPVVNSIYHEFKEFGNQPITSLATTYAESGRRFEPRLNGDDQETRAARAIIERVVELYGGYTGLQLSAMTHAEGTPWHQVYVESGPTLRGTDIPHHLIKSYFETQKQDTPEHA